MVFLLEEGVIQAAARDLDGRPMERPEKYLMDFLRDIKNGRGKDKIISIRNLNRSYWSRRRNGLLR